MLNSRESVYFSSQLLAASSVTALIASSYLLGQPSLANPQEPSSQPQPVSSLDSETQLTLAASAIASPLLAPGSQAPAQARVRVDNLPVPVAVISNAPEAKSPTDVTQRSPQPLSPKASSQEPAGQQVVGQLPTLSPANEMPRGYVAPAIAPPNAAYPSYPAYPTYPGYPGYPIALPPAGYAPSPYPAYPVYPYPPYPYFSGQPGPPVVPPQPAPNWAAPPMNPNVGAMPSAPSYYPTGYPAYPYPYPYPYPAYPYPYPSGQPAVPPVAPQPAPAWAAPQPSYNWAAPLPPVAPLPTGQSPGLVPPSNLSAPRVQPLSPMMPVAPVVPSAPPAPQPSLPTEAVVQEPSPSSRSLLGRSSALSDPTFQVQGVYVYQGDESSARGRFSATYPLTPRVLFGTTLDLTTGNAFTDSRQEGLSLNELYVATSLEGLPNLRFVVGQLDLTSYFDRNSFAKDGASHFFNPVFQTNPALTASSIGSRPGALVNWALTDSLEAKAAVFSSSRSISDFALDGFAGEIGLRYGNAIIRGTYASGRDAGSRDGFREIFQVSRDGGLTSGPGSGDREEAFGVNAEVFIPSLSMGLFGRYGQYNNRDLDRQGDTYNVGLTFLDLFAPDDRLGLAYGRQLSNTTLRRQQGDRNPDVLELYYDFRFLPNLRIGFTVQELNNFSEIIAGVRLKTEFDVSPRGREAR